VLEWCLEIAKLGLLVGSHGAGLPSETLTPLVVWGSGARKHSFVQSPLGTDAIELTR